MFQTFHGLARKYSLEERITKYADFDIAYHRRADLDKRGEAGGEHVGRNEVVHGQQLAGLAGCQLNAVLHGSAAGKLGERVAAWCNTLNTINMRNLFQIHVLLAAAKTLLHKLEIIKLIMAVKVNAII